MRIFSYDTAQRLAAQDGHWTTRPVRGDLSAYCVWSGASDHVVEFDSSPWLDGVLTPEDSAAQARYEAERSVPPA